MRVLVLIISLSLIPTLYAADVGTGAITVVNGSFEEPRITPGSADFSQVNASLVQGWETTSPDELIEFWTDGFGYVPYDGFQFIEINATQPATIFQDVLIVSGSFIYFEFAHRARANTGLETLHFGLTDLGADGVPGGGDDTSLYNSAYSADSQAWSVNNNCEGPPVVALGNLVRISFESQIPGPEGNLIDGFVLRTECVIFCDGFEAGDVSTWSSTTP